MAHETLPLAASSVHCPLTDATRGLINADVLAKMKPQTYIINTARGAIIDEADLLAALDSGHLAGAALDVQWPEPPLPDSRLYTHESVILTPPYWLEETGDTTTTGRHGRCQWCVYCNHSNQEPYTTVVALSSCLASAVRYCAQSRRTCVESRRMWCVHQRACSTTETAEAPVGTNWEHPPRTRTVNSHTGATSTAP